MRIAVAGDHAGFADTVRRTLLVTAGQAAKIAHLALVPQERVPIPLPGSATSNDLIFVIHCSRIGAYSFVRQSTEIPHSVSRPQKRMLRIVLTGSKYRRRKTVRLPKFANRCYSFDKKMTLRIYIISSEKDWMDDTVPGERE